MDSLRSMTGRHTSGAELFLSNNAYGYDVDVDADGGDDHDDDDDDERSRRLCRHIHFCGHDVDLTIYNFFLHACALLAEVTCCLK